MYAKSWKRNYHCLKKPTFRWVVDKVSCDSVKQILASSTRRLGMRIGLCLLLCAAMFGQSDRGTVTGTVIDASGAVVPNAIVIVKHDGTGVEARTVTTSTGSYTVPSLQAGGYSVIVEAPGFKRVVQQGIDIQVA